jgi:hypothetical protein
MRTAIFLWVLGWSSAFGVGLACSHGPADCSNGTCVCEAGASCEFECEAPPCHIDCAGDNEDCHGVCGNGECTCGDESHCDFACHSPPCHVACGHGSECAGTCANGSCSCAAGSTCDFECQSGPCHVLCQGDHPHCDGTCANGTCACGPDSACAFECLDANCTATCAAGSACSLRCPGGSPGAQGCSFTSCAAGPATVCDDGETIVCGTTCPPPASETDDR